MIYIIIIINFPKKVTDTGDGFDDDDDDDDDYDDDDDRFIV